MSSYRGKKKVTMDVWQKGGEKTRLLICVHVQFRLIILLSDCLKITHSLAIVVTDISGPKKTQNSYINVTFLQNGALILSIY